MTEEQLPLIDVTPEHSAEFVASAKRYRHAQTVKARANEEIKAEKKVLLSLVDLDELQPLEDGSIEFAVEGFKITITPQEDAVKVKEEGGDD